MDVIVIDGVKMSGPSGATEGSTGVMEVSDNEAVSFEAQVKPLFRPLDQKSMSSAFDLWSYQDVSGHAEAILSQLQAGTMPCDGAWAPDKVDIFRRWVGTGKQP